MGHKIKHYFWPVVVFAFVCVIGYAARRAIGGIYSTAEATQLLEALSRAGLYLGSAIATASATTLALMLTMIGMIKRMDEDFDHESYRNIDVVAKLATASLMISLLVLLAFTLPVGEFEELPGTWYTTLYEFLFAGCVVMVGLSAATVAMIYRTLRQVMAKITPGDGL